MGGGIYIKFDRKQKNTVSDGSVNIQRTNIRKGLRFLSQKLSKQISRGPSKTLVSLEAEGSRTRSKAENSPEEVDSQLTPKKCTKTIKSLSPLPLTPSSDVSLVVPTQEPMPSNVNNLAEHIDPQKSTQLVSKLDSDRVEDPLNLLTNAAVQIDQFALQTVQLQSSQPLLSQAREVELHEANQSPVQSIESNPTLDSTKAMIDIAQYPDASTHNHSDLDKRETVSQFPEKLTLRLVPKNKQVMEAVAQAGFNPRLELTLKVLMKRFCLFAFVLVFSYCFRACI